MTESSSSVESLHRGSSRITLFRSRLPMQKSFYLFAAVVLACGLPACSSVRGTYVWADAYKDAPARAERLITEGDLVSVRVREDEKFSIRERVQGGRLPLPLVDGVDVANQTTTQVARRIEDRLKAEKLFTSPACDRRD